MAGETNVGGILGFLRLDANQFHREIEQAIAEVDLLDGKNVDVKVRADTTGAAAKLEATERQVDKLDKSSARVSVSSREAGRGVGALATAVIALGPAIVPLAAGAAGLGAAFGGLGAAGVLAIVGITDEMKKGTALGLTYQSTIDDAKTSVMGLAQVAAANVLGPLQAAVKDLQDKTPRLTGIIGEFSTMAGRTAGNLTTGLLSAFIALEPLMRDAGVYIQNLSKRFADAMSGPGIVAFGDYVRSVFPQVMASVESIVTAAVHLVAAFAPLGGGVLTSIKLLADIITQFDPSALTAVATAAGAVFIGVRSWQGLSGLVGKLSTALEGVGISGERAAGGIRALNAAAGIVGIAIAGLSLLMTTMSTNSAEAQAATDSLADALIRSNGAIDEGVRLTALKNAQDSGALDNARLLGISTQQVVDAYLGQGAALGDLSAQRDAALTKQKALVDAGKADASTMTDVETAYLNLKNQLAAAGIQWDDSKVKVQQHTDVLNANKGATSDAAIAMQNLASTYGTTAPVMQAVIDAQKKSAEQAALATAQMVYENNAAGLLKQSLDALSGKSLSAAQAQNAFDSSLANMGDHVTAQGKKIHFTTTSIKDMSSASVALRGQLLGQVTAAEQTAEAYGQMKGSSEAGRKKLIELRDQIIKNAVAHGVDKKAVEDYIGQVLDVNNLKVQPTKLDVDTAAALKKKKALQDSIDALKGKTVTLRINEVFAYTKLSAQSASAADRQVADMFGKAGSANAASRANGGPVPGFAGGTLVGPGTGTSDSIMAMVAETGRILRVSAGEFVSTDASRRRNRAVLEAGNRGATLQVAGGTGGGGMSASEMRMLARLIGAEFRSVRPVVDVDALSSRMVGGMSS